MLTLNMGNQLHSGRWLLLAMLLARSRLSILVVAYPKAVIEVLRSRIYFGHPLADTDNVQHPTPSSLSVSAKDSFTLKQLYLLSYCSCGILLVEFFPIFS